MKESNIDPEDCLEEYPEVNEALNKELLKTTPRSKCPDKWPITWTSTAIYTFENNKGDEIEALIKPESKKKYYGITHWKLEAKKKSLKFQSVELCKSKSLKKVINYLEVWIKKDKHNNFD